MDGRCLSNGGGLTADESQLLYAVSAMHGQHGPEAQREAHASLMVFQASVEAWGVFLRLLRIVSASADSASTSTGTSDSASAGTFASASAAVASASASAGPQGHSEAERFYVLQALGDKVARQWAQCPGECRVPLLESATHLVQLVVGGATDLSPLLVRRLCLLFAGLALRASPEEWPDPFGDMHSLLLAGGGGGERGERSMAGSPVHTRAEFVVLELFALLPEELERVGGAAATALLRIRPSVMGMLDTLMRTAVGAGAEDPAMSTMTLSKSLRCLESWVACSVSADCDDGGRGGGGGGSLQRVGVPLGVLHQETSLLEMVFEVLSAHPDSAVRLAAANVLVEALSYPSPEVEWLMQYASSGKGEVNSTDILWGGGNPEEHPLVFPATPHEYANQIRVVAWCVEAFLGINRETQEEDQGAGGQRGEGASQTYTQRRQHLLSRPTCLVAAALGDHHASTWLFVPTPCIPVDAAPGGQHPYPGLLRNAAEMLELLLGVTAHPDLAVAELTLDFWSGLGDALGCMPAQSTCWLACDNPAMSPGFASPCPDSFSNALLQRVIANMCQQCMLPDEAVEVDHEHGLLNDESSRDDFRRHGRDTILVICEAQWMWWDDDSRRRGGAWEDGELHGAQDAVLGVLLCILRQSLASSTDLEGATMAGGGDVGVRMCAEAHALDLSEPDSFGWWKCGLRLAEASLQLMIGVAESAMGDVDEGEEEDDADDDDDDHDSGEAGVWEFVIAWMTHHLGSDSQFAQLAGGEGGVEVVRGGVEGAADGAEEMAQLLKTSAQLIGVLVPYMPTHPGTAAAAVAMLGRCFTGLDDGCAAVPCKAILDILRYRACGRAIVRANDGGTLMRFLDDYETFTRGRPANLAMATCQCYLVEGLVGGVLRWLPDPADAVSLYERVLFPICSRLQDMLAQAPEILGATGAADAPGAAEREMFKDILVGDARVLHKACTCVPVVEGLATVLVEAWKLLLTLDDQLAVPAGIVELSSYIWGALGESAGKLIRLTMGEATAYELCEFMIAQLVARFAQSPLPCHLDALGNIVEGLVAASVSSGDHQTARLETLGSTVTNSACDIVCHALHLLSDGGENTLAGARLVELAAGLFSVLNTIAGCRPEILLANVDAGQVPVLPSHMLVMAVNCLCMETDGWDRNTIRHPATFVTTLFRRPPQAWIGCYNDVAGEAAHSLLRHVLESVIKASDPDDDDRAQAGYPVRVLVELLYTVVHGGGDDGRGSNAGAGCSPPGFERLFHEALHQLINEAPLDAVFSTPVLKQGFLHACLAPPIMAGSGVSAGRGGGGVSRRARQAAEISHKRLFKALIVDLGLVGAGQMDLRSFVVRLPGCGDYGQQCHEGDGESDGSEIDIV